MDLNLEKEDPLATLSTYVFAKDKKIWRKYNPNLPMDDTSLKMFLEQYYKQDPHFKFEKWIKQHQQKGTLKHILKEWLNSQKTDFPKSVLLTKENYPIPAIPFGDNVYTLATLAPVVKSTFKVPVRSKSMSSFRTYFKADVFIEV